MEYQWKDNENNFAARKVFSLQSYLYQIAAEDLILLGKQIKNYDFTNALRTRLSKYGNFSHILIPRIYDFG